MPEGSTKSSRLTTTAALAIAAMGMSHLVKPQAWEPLTQPAFPRRTRQHIYANGGIETALGLALVSRRTRRAAAVGGVGYLAYLAGNVLRNNR